ncbi:Uncharacterized protein HZ326_31507 [Fusarium oxysporum f. sp. albedinis]|nr:Uncharacterized protein HZ326_31507 [Fusarium oxysporum f. sp. albedinis]
MTWREYIPTYKFTRFLVLEPQITSHREHTFGKKKKKKNPPDCSVELMASLMPGPHVTASATVQDSNL